MADPRFHSHHLNDLTRRHHYRQARQEVLAARGKVTWAAEQLGHCLGDVDD